MTLRPYTLMLSSTLFVIACHRGERSGHTDSNRASASVGSESLQVRAPAQVAWTADALALLRAQLARELFVVDSSSFVPRLSDCPDDDAEEEPPPGLAVARFAIPENPIVKLDSARRAVTVRVIAISVAATQHHEGGDQVDLDVAVAPRTDTLDFLMEGPSNQQADWTTCLPRLFLHRGQLGWATVKQWRPEGASWSLVSQLADSVTRAGFR